MASEEEEEEEEEEAVQRTKNTTYTEHDTQEKRGEKKGKPRGRSVHAELWKFVEPRRGSYHMRTLRGAGVGMVKPKMSKTPQKTRHHTEKKGGGRNGKEGSGGGVVDGIRA